MLQIWLKKSRNKPAPAVQKQIKLYFMIGLPGETDADVLGIAETIEWLQRECRTGRWHLAVNVTISNFTPKPHTPFQWHSVSTAEFARKQASPERGCGSLHVSGRAAGTRAAEAACHVIPRLPCGVACWAGSVQPAARLLRCQPAAPGHRPARPSAPATCPPELNRMPIPTWTLTLPRQALLKEAMGRLHQVKANFTSIRLSAMEDFIGRGDRSIGPVLRRAWELVRGRGGGPRRRPAVAAADVRRACSDSSAVGGRRGGPAGPKV